MKKQLKLIKSNEVWSINGRYAVNKIVSYLGVDYQNTTGSNSVPTDLIDWVTTQSKGLIETTTGNDTTQPIKTNYLTIDNNSNSNEGLYTIDNPYNDFISYMSHASGGDVDFYFAKVFRSSGVFNILGIVKENNNAEINNATLLTVPDLNNNFSGSGTDYESKVMKAVVTVPFPTLPDFPTTGLAGVVYLAEDSQLQYIWQFDSYVEVGNFNPSNYDLANFQNDNLYFLNNENTITIFGQSLLGAGNDITIDTSQVTEVSGRKYQTDNQALFNDATSSIQTQLNSKLTSLRGTFSASATAQTTFTVTFGGTQPNNTYFVGITPRNSLTASQNFIMTKTTTSFTVTFLTGLSGSVSFDWVLHQ